MDEETDACLTFTGSGIVSSPPYRMALTSVCFSAPESSSRPSCESESTTGLVAVITTSASTGAMYSSEAMLSMYASSFSSL